MQAEKYLKCTDCGHPLKLEMAHDGADWECERGEGSGFGNVVYLSCDGCGRIYEIVRYRNHGDVSVPIEKQRSFFY